MTLAARLRCRRGARGDAPAASLAIAIQPPATAVEGRAAAMRCSPRQPRQFSKERPAMAESDILKFDRRPNHVVLTLNRPEKRNALNRAMFEALDRAFEKIEADKSIRAIVLRGEGS